MGRRTALRTAELVRSGALTAIEAVEESLTAARRLDPVLNFLEELDADGARRAAARVDPAGALAGVPFLVKARTPPESPILHRLVAAGAVPIGRGVGTVAVGRARVVRDYNNTALADLFGEVDVLVTPTTLTVAHGYDQHEESIVTGDPCWIFNVTGHPAVSVPAGLLDGLPVGAQIVAPYGADHLALAVARRLQTALPPPPVHA